MTNKIPKWKRSYKIGIPPVDFQHKYFLQLIHQFHSVCSNNNLQDKMLGRMLRELLKYVEFHFQSEENLMMLYNYPQIEKHHEQHLDLADRLCSMLNHSEFNQQQATEIIDYLVSWFIEHTIIEDKEFGKFAKKLKGSVTIA